MGDWVHEQNREITSRQNDREMSEWMDVNTEGKKKEGWTEGGKCGMDGLMVGRMDGRMDGWM